MKALLGAVLALLGGWIGAACLVEWASEGGSRAGQELTGAALLAIICPGKRNVTAAGHGLGALGGRGGQERSDQGGAVSLAV
jgi:hypothetical protein